mmetsp:Transcript_49994/g.112298  ORF Transcript_49994/g.112298 Transcript_49994/m.112298 type:complete len:200 (+) Transcript_49994:177-776(+)
MLFRCRLILNGFPEHVHHCLVGAALLGQVEGGAPRHAARTVPSMQVRTAFQQRLQASAPVYVAAEGCEMEGCLTEARGAVHLSAGCEKLRHSLCVAVGRGEVQRRVPASVRHGQVAAFADEGAQRRGVAASSRFEALGQLLLGQGGNCRPCRLLSRGLGDGSARLPSVLATLLAAAPLGSALGRLRSGRLRRLHLLLLA